MWHGTDLILPAELGAAMMFDLVDTQLGEDTAIFRAIKEAIGPDQWAKARKAAAEEHLPAQAFHDLISEILGFYGMGPGEPEASSPSANGDGGN